jgi:hypothetical protein
VVATTAEGRCVGFGAAVCANAALVLKTPHATRTAVRLAMCTPDVDGAR